jgi:hypothetical protein
VRHWAKIAFVVVDMGFGTVVDRGSVGDSCSCSNRHRVSKNGSTSMPCWAWQGRTGCCGQERVNKNRNKL